MVGRVTRSFDCGFENKFLPMALTFTRNPENAPGVAGKQRLPDLADEKGPEQIRQDTILSLQVHCSWEKQLI